MSSIAHSSVGAPQVRPRPNLRPLALPTEHGGWGFLFEPMLLGLVVAPSAGGVLLAFAALAGFLARQPLRLALQDLLRGRSYPRTAWCRGFAALYLFAAAAFFAGAVATSGWVMFIPLGLVAPLAMTQVLYDAQNQSRSLLPELCGAAAMSSIAASIAICGGMHILPAMLLSGVILARTIPSILYVRTLLQRAHGLAASSSPALLLHVAAVVLVAVSAPLLAAAAMLILLARAIHSLSHEPPNARTLGWREVAYGVMTVALAAGGFLL